MHDCDGDDFGLPLQAERGAEAVVDKGPGHLDHFLQLVLVS